MCFSPPPPPSPSPPTPPPISKNSQELFFFRSDKHQVSFVCSTPELFHTRLLARPTHHATRDPNPNSPPPHRRELGQAAAGRRLACEWCALFVSPFRPPARERGECLCSEYTRRITRIDANALESRRSPNREQMTGLRSYHQSGKVMHFSSYGTH